MRLEDQVAVLTVLDKRVKAELAARKAAWAEQARPKDRDAAMLGDAELGTVTLTAGRVSWKVTDKAALVAWAVENAPHLVQFSPHIPDDTLKTLLKDPTTPDGEILPGVEQTQGAPYPSVRLSKDADRAVAEAVAGGSLSWGEVLELE